MRRPALLLLVATAGWAHVVSMSSSELTINGARGLLELRIPMYEIAHVATPETTLLGRLRFSGARMVTSECAPDAQGAQYICRAEYAFDAPVESLEVECTLAAATVPNHVHLLRVEMGGKRDRGVFDASFTRATLRFRPPTAAEVAVTEAGAGAVRALGGAVQLLFLAALAIAARTRREMLAMAAMFAAGQIFAVLVLRQTGWQPAPRFVEAAAALTLAYLSVEILWLGGAGGRWIVAGVLGGFHGLYFHMFLQGAGYGAGWVLAGAVLAEFTALALLAVLFRWLRRVAGAFRPVQVSAAAMMAFGLVWFVLRLRS